MSRWGDPVRAVLLDLDDTLYPQRAFLAGAWADVAAAGAALGLEGGTLHLALLDAAALGSDRGGIIDRAVDAVEGDPAVVPELVAAFHAHRPPHLAPFRGVANALDRLAGVVRLGCITDGDPAQQRAKLAATGLADVFEVVVCTDEHGRRHRKPHPLGFRVALASLGVPATACVMVGDRPDKDVVGAHRVGMVAIRVRQGEHADQPSLGAPTVDTTPEALDEIAARVGALR